MMSGADLVDHDVGGLQIAVDDARFVRALRPVDDLSCQGSASETGSFPLLLRSVAEVGTLQ